MPINTNVTKDQITVSVGETQIDVNVSGGVGPTGNSGTIAVSAPITNAGTSTAAVIGLSTGTGLAVSAGSLTVSYGTTAGTACQGNDARLSDAREWSAATVTQAEAEAGTATDRKAFTPLRVFQAIAAWWAGSAAKTKLDGIASGATANQTDAYLLSRANHTGTQLASTISDFTTAVVAAAPPTTNASLLTTGTLPDARLSANIARTSDVSSAVASLVNSAPATLDTLAELASALGSDANFSTTVTNALASKAPINNPTFTGTVSGITKAMVGLSNADNTSDASKPVSTAQAAADAAVASAAAADATSKANAAQAAAVQRANHTGTQAIGTVDGLQTALDGKAAVSHAHAVADITGLANVATSGSYNDLTNKPTIPSAYTLPTASATVLGGVKIGSGLSIDGSSVLSTTYSYTLPNATTSTLGGVIVGTGLSVTSGTVSVTYGTTSGTACQGNDSRLSDSRTPTSHASSHASGGSDAISIAASQITSGTVAAARLGSGSASSNTYLRGDQSWYAPTASDVGAAATAEVLDFTVSTKPAAATGSNGSYTYTIPATAKAVRVYAIGGGAGGGSGRRGAAGSARFGGGGGSTSGVLDIVISSNDFGSNRTATITVGSGGAGGAAVTANDTNGNNGTNGAASSVTINSKTFGAAGGGSGSGGSNVSGNTGNPLGAQFQGQVGGNSSATANAGNASYGSLNVTAPGGGGGGGISTGDTSYNGGGTRFDAPYNGSTNFNNGGTAPGGTGAAGLSNSFGLPLPGGSGSGGGAGNASTAGGAGGNGGDYGGGGGGGGASFNGFSSGAGGNGGNGFVRLVVYY